jgi:hypothetical protein
LIGIGELLGSATPQFGLLDNKPRPSGRQFLPNPVN